jgi:hypothetical protein
MDRAQDTFAMIRGGGEGGPDLFITDTTADTGTAGTAIQNSDLLRYVGDMLEELQCMCTRTGCTTLLGLLALAHAEALLQQSVGSNARRAG